MSEPLWIPSRQRIQKSRMYQFLKKREAATYLSFPDYHALYNWSIANIDSFWEAIWDEAEIIHSQKYTSVRTGAEMLDTKWFTGAKLNFAENLLRYRDNQTALIGYAEDSETIRISYAELFAQVASLAAYFRSIAVKPGDRIAGYMPNIPETVIAMLATTAIGAIWSSCSPDFGIQGVLDRFGQITPKVLITAHGNRYAGKEIDTYERALLVANQIPEIEQIIVVTRLKEITNKSLPANVTLWNTALSQKTNELDFYQAPFDYPLYIMYSSGTTGKPKCMVHGTGGTLLQHFKELALHTDLRRDDVIFYYTTCGWMMWNWLISSLSIGATVLLYDGAPSHPNIDVLWNIAETERISVFGTSPKFLAACDHLARYPSRDHNLEKLRAILSTGSPLSEEQFRWVYKQVKADLQLSSISGGTDIVSCFMLGSPMLPVYPGEIQCRGLGMDVHAFNDNGKPVIDEVGELVCKSPFPSMPVSFWNDPNGNAYKAAYFDHYPNIWRHGDFIKITAHGGVIVYGRSDATLNPGGVRIGTAEIYDPVESLPEIQDSLVIGQQIDGDVRIILFVVLRDGQTLTNELKDRIRAKIRETQTPRHLPARIIQILDVPRTISGKKVELAVANIIHGRTVTNRDALANPAALDQFTDLAELHT